MNREQLEQVRMWADDKLATGEAPPWAWYQYMKLRETLDAILSGMDAAKPQDSPGSAPRSEKHLRLVESTGSQESAPRRRDVEPVQMPM
jgi:hypothetical protein